MEPKALRQLLLPRGVIEFRQPAVSAEGFVICEEDGGERFLVHPQRVNADRAAQNRARCFGNDQLGDPLWEPIPTITVQITDY